MTLRLARTQVLLILLSALVTGCVSGPGVGRTLSGSGNQLDNRWTTPDTESPVVFDTVVEVHSDTKVLFRGTAKLGPFDTGLTGLLLALEGEGFSKRIYSIINGRLVSFGSTVGTWCYSVDGKFPTGPLRPGQTIRWYLADAKCKPLNLELHVKGLE